MVDLIKMGHCFHCGSPCVKISEKNRFGQTKQYCCICYENTQHKKQYNPTFGYDVFCPMCHSRRLSLAKLSPDIERGIGIDFFKMPYHRQKRCLEYLRQEFMRRTIELPDNQNCGCCGESKDCSIRLTPNWNGFCHLWREVGGE